MTAANHIAGGIVFTGLFCSLFQVNIFANPLFIGVTIIASLLPDIDHTKSIIGKVFYPLARWLSINYGHRTITHSIFFLVGISIISVFTEKVFNDSYSFSLIIFFGLLSHLIFDMITLQGIPLFFPFYKNPCVLPANPELRINSGNIKQEGVILFIFCLLTFFMQDLFANGFWSTLNNNFNDINHQSKEYKNNTGVLEIEYDYNIYQSNFKGTGFLIYATNEELFIISNNKLITLKENIPGIKINTLKTTKTDKKISISEVDINEKSELEINNILKNKFINTGLLYTNYPTAVNLNPLDFKKKFKLENNYNISFKSFTKDTLIQKKIERINELELKIKTEENQLYNDNKNYYLALEELHLLKTKLKINLSNYELNEVKIKIIDLERKISNYQLKTNLMIPVYKKQLEALRVEKIDEIRYNGVLSFIDSGK